MPTATTDQIVDALNYCLSHLANSTAGYILDSNPYSTEADKAAIAALKEIAASDADHVLRCVGLIESLEGVPRSGIADPMVAELNYLSFPYLLDVMIKRFTEEHDRFAKTADSMPSDTPEKAFIVEVRDARASQLKKLKEVREKNYKSE